MEINFKGPVMPIDPYSQLAFVEILNIILTAGHIVDVNVFPHQKERQPPVRLPVRLFQAVVRRRPLYALATYGLQLHDVFQPQDTGLALRCPGRKRQRKETELLN